MNPIYRALLFFGYTILVLDLISMGLGYGHQTSLAFGLSIVVLILSIITILIGVIGGRREAKGEE